MDPFQRWHKFAVVKLFPGLDEKIFENLLNGLGLEVFFTNDLKEDSPERKGRNDAENWEGSIPSIEDSSIQISSEETAAREWMAFIQYIENNVKVELNSCTADEIPSASGLSTTIGERITSTPAEEDGDKPSYTCALCREVVKTDKKSLKQHVQTHTGKRYGCNICEYHTDRKFDFTRHIRRRHEGIVDQVDVGIRPHWMSLLKTCFPDYGDATKCRRIRRLKLLSGGGGNCAQEGIGRRKIGKTM
ncbi:hypothetical protein Q1695_004689 [Nippostrongylus brasiliensis]|nr:hypothetical protein Q1695_004689 [Nippostrongylus brasiliensis]